MDQDRKHNKLSSFHVYIPLTVCKSSQIFLKFLLIYPTSPIKTQEVSENGKSALFFSFCPNSLFFWLSQVVICLYSFISPGGYNEEQPYHVLVLPFSSHIFGLKGISLKLGFVGNHTHGGKCVCFNQVNSEWIKTFFFSSWRKKGNKWIHGV
ncbi:hypothetical protein BDA99DRAFT_528679, partial [Phascolomyces articulosus]